VLVQSQFDGVSLGMQSAFLTNFFICGGRAVFGGHKHSLSGDYVRLCFITCRASMPLCALVLFLRSSPQSLLLVIPLCWEVSFLAAGSLPWGMDSMHSTDYISAVVDP